jgi:O-glycosyl hydrolase
LTQDLSQVPLGACDFGFQPYTYDDTFDGSTDLNLTLFNVDRAPKIWQLLQDIISVQPELKTYYAAWSPPAWMKCVRRRRVAYERC